MQLSSRGFSKIVLDRFSVGSHFPLKAEELTYRVFGSRFTSLHGRSPTLLGVAIGNALFSRVVVDVSFQGNTHLVSDKTDLGALEMPVGSPVAARRVAPRR